MTQSLQLGPLALPLELLVIAGAVAFGLFVGKRIGRKAGVDVEPLLFKVLLVSVACARLAFVWQYRIAYLGAPLGILDIRDGGWAPWAGLIAAWVCILVLAWRRPPMRKPLLAAALTACVLWMAGSITLAIRPQDNAGLPDMALSTTEGGTVSLRAFEGKPTVVNLWATWCPPCQREMPVFALAQAGHPELHFVFLNQGEAAEQVRRFLATRNLSLRNVLLDPKGQAGAAFSQQALPTTLFFDAQGRLVDTRVGELSRATLTQRLDALGSRPSISHPSPSKPSE